MARPKPLPEAESLIVYGKLSPVLHQKFMKFIHDEGYPSTAEAIRQAIRQLIRKEHTHVS
jgi:metal-responsive CopG/Arc/MetJ family transcriptional regulator